MGRTPVGYREAFGTVGAVRIPACDGRKGTPPALFVIPAKSACTVKQRYKARRGALGGTDTTGVPNYLNPPVLVYRLKWVDALSRLPTAAESHSSSSGGLRPEMLRIDAEHSRSPFDTPALIFAGKDSAIAATWQRQDARSTFHSRPRPQVSRDRSGCTENCAPPSSRAACPRRLVSHRRAIWPGNIAYRAERSSPHSSD